jgi:hypothetical protein
MARYGDRTPSLYIRFRVRVAALLTDPPSGFSCVLGEYTDH